MRDAFSAPRSADGEWITVCRSARLTPAEYRFYRAVLLTFAQRGHGPDLSELESLAQRFGVSLARTLEQMSTKDLLQLDLSTGHLRAAYPFSGVETPHRVVLLADQSGERTDEVEADVFAMCALDALGVPLMLRRAAIVVSADALSSSPIRVLVRPTRHPHHLPLAIPLTDWHAQWDPPHAVVYARPSEHEAEHDAGTCVAAGTCCPVINFFSTPDCAAEWIARQPPGSLDGLVLGQAEALRRAYALFAGVLDRHPRDAVQDCGDERSGCQVEEWATVQCPQCGERTVVQMPTDACQVRLACPSCEAVLVPLPGDCCVFCSFADRPCPPEQEARYVRANTTPRA